MPSSTITDYERTFLLNTLGSAALPTDSMTQLRYKFYSGVVNGTLSLGGGAAPIPIPVGKSAMLTRNDNGASKVPSVQGNEYAFGIFMQAGTYDRFSLECGIAGGAGATMRLCFRPVDLTTGLIGAPVANSQHTVDLTAIGARNSVGSAFTLAAQLYALCYARYSDTGDTAQVQKGPAYLNPNIIPLQFSTGNPSVGHAPYVTLLNTGVAGAFPSSTVVTDVGSNVDANVLPQIVIRRSA